MRRTTYGQVQGLDDEDAVEARVEHLLVRARPSGATCDDRRTVFRFLLKLEDGEPYDPAAFVTVIPSWSVGETFLVTAHQRLRIIAQDFDLARSRRLSASSH